MILAGFPATMVIGGTSSVTTLCAPMMDPYPILTPGRMVEFLGCLHRGENVVDKGIVARVGWRYHFAV